MEGLPASNEPGEGLAGGRTERRADPDFRSLADSAPVIMWVTDPDGYCTYLNRRWYELTGQTPAEAEGFGWLDATHPDDKEEAGRIFVAANAAQEPFNAEYRLRGKDGEYRWVIDMGSPRFGPGGEYLGYIGSVVDIHERRVAELKLQDSEARLRALTDNLPGGMVYQVSTGADGSRRDFFYVSQSVEGLSGVPAAEILANPGSLYDLILEEDRPRLMAAEREAIASGKVFDVEARFRRRDGEIRWSRIISAPRRQDGVTIWDGIQIDITDQKAAEEVLRQGQSELQTMADALPALIAYVDKDERYQFNNKAYEDWFGHDREALRGRKVREVIGERAYAEVKPEMDRALAGERFGAELSIHYEKGGLRDVRVDYVPRIDAEGNVLGFYGLVQDISESRRAEAALRESEERYREQFEHANDFIFTTDLKLMITSCNPAIAAALGYSQGELIGRSVADFLSSEMLEQSKGLLAAKLSGEREATRYEVEVKGPDGALMVWDVNSRLTRDSQGNPTGLHAIARDIGERKRAEAALRESEERFRRIADSAPVPMWVTLLNRKRGFVNQAYVDFLNISFEEAVDFDWRSIIHPDDEARIIQESIAGEASLQTFTLEGRYKGGDGKWHWIRSISQPRFDAEGKHAGFIGVAHDITDAKEAEIALRESEARFEAIANSIDQMVWSTRPDGYHDFFNQRWYDYTGVPAGSTDGAGWSEIFHPEDQERAWEVWQHSLRTGELYQIEYRLRHNSGEYRWVLGRAQPLRDESGAITRWFGTCTDIQEIVEAREVLARSREELEQEVQRRTAQLEQAQEALRQSQKLEAMGQLTGGVAHDFNNLLTPIIGSLDLLHRRQLGGEREQRLIDGALQSAERAKTLVQRLLAFARRQPLQASAVDVATLVRGMIDLVASTSGPQIRVQVDLPADLPPANADPNQLEMAILNLSVNARDAMPDGGTLTISASREEAGERNQAGLAPGSYVRLSVADTGTGMDEAVLARAIEPFFSTKGVGKGTGLGLSMVHGLASQLSGALQIKSRPGLGTNVELWLPVSEQAPDAEAQREGQESAVGKAAGTALLVDDEDLVRMSTADMLGELGYEVIEATSAREALSLLEKGRRPDVLVSDHLMPGMTGADLAREVRERWPGLPVLIISGYAEAEGIAPDLPRLTKPFRQSDLGTSLAALSGRSDRA